MGDKMEDKIMNFMDNNIEQVIFSAVKADEQIIKYLKSFNEIVLRIYIEKNEIKIKLQAGKRFNFLTECLKKLEELLKGVNV